MTDSRLMECMGAMTKTLVALEQAVGELVGFFPGVASAFAWKTAVADARSRYQQNGLADDAFQAAIAQHWAALAKARKLEATMDRAAGMIVRETA